MADTTIIGLNNLSPSTNTYIPLSNGTATGKALYNPVPVGGIIMWSGAVANIPTGWALCNGQVVNGNTTPNLLDKFIVGAGSATYNPGNTGGTSAITPAGTVSSTAITPAGTVGGTTLTTAQIPAHTHTLTDPGHFHATNIAADGGGGSLRSFGQQQFDNPTMINTDSKTTGITIAAAGGGGSHTHTFNGTSQSHTHTFTGTSQANLPPYYALAYIMRVY